MIESMRKELAYFRTVIAERPHYDEAVCNGCRLCYEVCPVLCWAPAERKMVLAHPERCVACAACVLQCPTGAARLA
ncbi:MAG: 4Fe-4S binding protein [Chloroflexi bacterium]|nr:4Fe-4S binding protein [Chloroflexota bacterium]MBU1752140.1 4Fe-4S binding protein [Chloroflexota bacterium]MBU1878266.1 4Fe-4S binding protein [Chloroflexota bacterium]